MIGFKHTREMFIPQNALKVTDKASGGVAYLFNSERGSPCAKGFAGKAAKPCFNYSFKSEAAREKHVREFFAGLTARAKSKAEYRAKQNAPAKLLVGHILVSSWGYDQTNVDWYQVTKIVSPTMVEIRKIGGASAGDTSNMTGKCVPAPDCFKGEPMRKRVSHGDQVKIKDYANAYLWDGKPRHWSSYH